MKNSITLEGLISLIEDTEYAVFKNKQTVCCLTLKNGFTVIGEAACVDPANFNEVIGREMAKKDAINNMWVLEGYRLQNELYGAAA